jgi:hypothetical protein
LKGIAPPFRAGEEMKNKTPMGFSPNKTIEINDQTIP